MQEIAVLARTFCLQIVVACHSQRVAETCICDRCPHVCYHSLVMPFHTPLIDLQQYILYCHGLPSSVHSSVLASLVSILAHTHRLLNRECYRCCTQRCLKLKIFPTLSEKNTVRSCLIFRVRDSFMLQGILLSPAVVRGKKKNPHLCDVIQYNQAHNVDFMLFPETSGMYYFLKPNLGEPGLLQHFNINVPFHTLVI